MGYPIYLKKGGNIYIMWVYIFLFILLGAGVISEQLRLKETLRKKVSFVLVLYMSLFAGLRYNTGGDFVHYKNFFEECVKEGNIYTWESGYFFLNFLIKTLFGKFVILQLLVSFFLSFSSYYFYKKESKYPIFIFSIFVSFTLYDYFFALIRQSIAVAIIFFASRFIFKREAKKYFLLVAIAFMFHSSAIIAIPLYFMCVSWGRVVPIVLLVLFQFAGPTLIMNVINGISFILPERMQMAVDIYFSSDVFSAPVSMGTGLYNLSRILLSIVVVFLFTKNDNRYSFFINCLVVSTIIRIIANEINILERTQIYFLMFGVLSYSFFLTDVKIHRIKKELVRMMITFVLFLFFFFPTYTHLTSTAKNALNHRTEYYRYVPYYNYISHPHEADKRKDWFEL